MAKATRNDTTRNNTAAVSRYLHDREEYRLERFKRANDALNELRLLLTEYDYKPSDKEHTAVLELCREADNTHASIR